MIASLPPKKPYLQPILVAYGDLLDMTKARSPMGQKDGGKDPLHGTA